MIFENLIEKLLPTGRAWLQRPVKIMGAILGGIADEMETVRASSLKLKDSIFPQLMDVEFIPDWENRFKLPFSAVMSEQERRDRLDSQWQQGGQSLEFIQSVLQEAGFDVYLKESAILADTLRLGDGETLGDSILEGNVVPGQIVTQCTSDDPNPSAFTLGDFTLDSSTYLGTIEVDPCKELGGTGFSLGTRDIILGDDITLETNQAKFIVNHIDDSLDPSETCPVIEQRCIFIFYIQGPGAFGDAASVPASRYAEFRELVLKHKPARTWAAAFIKLV